MKPLITIILFLTVLTTNAQKEYAINRFHSGNVKSHGWIDNKKKEAHWVYYYQDSLVKEKGTYKDLEEGSEERFLRSIFRIGDVQEGPFESYHDNGKLKEK